MVTGAIFGVFCGYIMHRTGHFREIMWVGTFLLTIGVGLFISFSATTSTAVVISFLVVAGLGSGILFEAPLIAVQSQTEQRHVASATATLSFVRNFALSISTIVGGTIFQNSMSRQVQGLREKGLPEDLLRKLDGDSAMANVMLPGTLANEVWKRASKEAFARAMRNMWITYTVFAAVSFVASGFVESAVLGEEHVETVTGLRGEREKKDGEA